jgi:hypothetical protein
MQKIVHQYHVYIDNATVEFFNYMSKQYRYRDQKFSDVDLYHKIIFIPPPPCQYASVRPKFTTPQMRTY